MNGKFKVGLSSIVIVSIFSFLVFGCDTQVPQSPPPQSTEVQNKVLSLEPLDTESQLAGQFRSAVTTEEQFKLSASTINWESLEVMRLKLDSIGVVDVVVAKTATNTRPAIKAGAAASSTGQEVSESRLYYVPSEDIMLRQDISFSGAERAEGTMRFAFLGPRVSATYSVANGRVTKQIGEVKLSAAANRLVAATDTPWTTGNCLETAFDACSADAECSILCGLMFTYCAGATLIACAISANN